MRLRSTLIRFFRAARVRVGRGLASDTSSVTTKESAASPSLQVEAQATASSKRESGVAIVIFSTSRSQTEGSRSTEVIFSSRISLFQRLLCSVPRI